jgi:hypothetical protein
MTEVLGDFDGPPPPEFLMDGIPHTAGSNCCMREFCRVPGCGGRVHAQGVYGGLAKICELCGDEQ